MSWSTWAARGRDARTPTSRASRRAKPTFERCALPITFILFSPPRKPRPVSKEKKVSGPRPDHLLSGRAPEGMDESRVEDQCLQAHPKNTHGRGWNRSPLVPLISRVEPEGSPFPPVRPGSTTRCGSGHALSALGAKGRAGVLRLGPALGAEPAFGLGCRLLSLADLRPSRRFISGLKVLMVLPMAPPSWGSLEAPKMSRRMMRMMMSSGVPRVPKRARAAHRVMAAPYPTISFRYFSFPTRRT